RVVPIVVENAEPLVAKDFLLASRGAAKGKERFGNLFGRITKLVEQRNDRSRVRHILLTEERNAEAAELLVITPNLEFATLSVTAVLAKLDAIRRLRTKSIRDRMAIAGKELA